MDGSTYPLRGAASAIIFAMLDAPGIRLLRLLIAHFPVIVPGDASTYIGYKQAHDELKLPQVHTSWGESLKPQGMNSLAEWVYDHSAPALTGLIVNKDSNLPGGGYFKIYGYENGFSPGFYPWWKDQIQQAIAYDWSPAFGTVKLVPTVISAPPAPTLSDSPSAQETVTRRVRDTALTKQVKLLHNHVCQVCSHTIILADGSRYAEGHHVKPLGSGHDGPDIQTNIMCVCPNCHVTLNYCITAIDVSSLRYVPGHTIAVEFIEHHNARVAKNHS
jgi:hypothetical protein